MADYKNFSDQAAIIEQFKVGLNEFFGLKVDTLAKELQSRIHHIFEIKIGGEACELKNDVTEKISKFQAKEIEINSSLDKLEVALDTKTAALTAGKAILETDISSAEAIADALKTLDSTIPEIDFNAS